MSVYVNNELGITRYIGNVDFASGVWLGVELRKPSKLLNQWYQGIIVLITLPFAVSSFVLSFFRAN